MTTKEINNKFIFSTLRDQLTNKQSKKKDQKLYSHSFHILGQTTYLCAKLGRNMRFNRVKSLLVAAFGLIMLSLSSGAFAQENKETGTEQKKGFDANEVIFGHVKDAHEFHFLSYKGSDGEEHEAIIPLPVILYSPQKGFSVFMSSAFHHNQIVDGYKLEEGKVVPLEPGIKVYDISLTRNVVQMLIALILFVWLMLSIAKKYKKGYGVISAPSGAQNAIEIVIDFITEQVAKPYLGKRYLKYLPYLLTVFFFILFNTFFGLIPGSANVTGNIAFTMILALIAFGVIMFSTNKHYWGHIINPPDVPGFVKPILVLVEILGIFTKPFALMIRLFANMLAGHIIIICLISLIFIFGALNKGLGWGFAPVSLAFSIFIYLIEVLIAFIQAFIFTNLTAVFIGQAMEGSHDAHGDEHVDAVMV